MKRKLCILAFAACCLLSCQDGLWNAIDDLRNQYADLESRVARLEELGDYVTKQVTQQSLLINSKKQTPTVTPSSSVGTEWQMWKLK